MSTLPLTEAEMSHFLERQRAAERELDDLPPLTEEQLRLITALLL